MTREITLTQGKFALVDDDVYEWASKYKWHARRDGKTFYAGRKGGVWPLKRVILLHREIMNPSAGVLIDHINGDGLDCRRRNMRLATHAENNRNRGRQNNNTSGYRGVYWSKGAEKWQVGIKVNGKVIHLGLFLDPEAAARAYDDAARKYHGEFARTNF